jgi:putative oxidoreductase
MMRSLVFGPTNSVSGFFPQIGLLVLRLGTGLGMALAHGLGKVPPPDRLVEAVTGMGFPLPVIFAWAAGLTELFGGLFIAIGLATRLSSALMAITMGVAFFVAHAADPFQNKELSFMYLFCSLAIFLLGPGKWSIDSRIK